MTSAGIRCFENICLKDHKIVKTYHECSLHDEKVGVWYVISACRIIGHIFYDDTVNAARYMNNILSPFFPELTEEKRL
jgi:hypothetical protein